MRLLLIFGILVLNISNTIFAQPANELSNSFSENIPDSTRFRFYLDSIDHYLYADLNLSEKYIELCESLIQKNISIAPSLKRKFINLTIDLESNKNHHLNAYKIFNEQKHFLSENISEEAIQGLKLKEGYILFSNDETIT